MCVYVYMITIINICYKTQCDYSCSDLMPEPAVGDLGSSSVSQHVVLHAFHTGVLSHFRAKCRLIVLHLCKHKHNPWIRRVLWIITSVWRGEKYPFLVSCFMWHHVSVIGTTTRFKELSRFNMNIKQTHISWYGLSHREHFSGHKLKKRKTEWNRWS